ncbi:spore coat protein GerQ [Fictibacillus barbaricus]|uniref:Spore germination protein Q n=1 Tax=Fictibacillus barbaricus TaxID=182136 RepID=A0ABU1U349_9BACL|nr:spore coat protein GerQ [Fictibacillus barbaricus]MDR7073915.1 spore germination protein Q [Fictibacillus barbaricus]
MSYYNPYYQNYRAQNGMGTMGSMGGMAGMGVPQDMAQSQQAPGMGGGPMADIGAPGQLPIEQSYIENILRMNKGKVATVYMTFENNEKWNAKVFKGIIEAAGRDHIILSDPQTGKRYLLLMVYVNYVTFDEEINYSYPYNGTQQQQQSGQGQSGQMAQYSPR